jgi:hypothetical protein
MNPNLYYVWHLTKREDRRKAVYSRSTTALRRLRVGLEIHLRDEDFAGVIIPNAGHAENQLIGFFPPGPIRAQRTVLYLSLFLFEFVQAVTV